MDSGRKGLEMDTMALYEIDRALLSVIESGYSVDDETGEVYFTSDDLADLEATRREKLEGCALYAKCLQAEADAIKAERDKLDARLKVKQSKADRMKEYIVTSMLLSQEKTFETARVAMRIRKSAFVDIACEPENLPIEYQRHKVTTVADKAALKAALKAGERIAGVSMGERSSLIIK